MQRHVAASAPVRYGIAVLFVMGASALALWIRPVTLAAGQLSLVAILLTGWICGLRPALVAWALTTVAFVYFFTSPFDSLAIEPAEIPRLLIFTLLGLFMATVSAARGRAQEALQRARTELETRVRERTTDLQAHLWLLESLDRIHRTIQATNDVDQMTSHVLETVVTIVGCDQAWLVSPCDPAAPSWRVAMEHTRPPLAGAVPRGVEQPMEPDVADLFRRVRASDGPVWFGTGTAPPLPAEIAKRFGIQSQIAVAMYPKDVPPYLFAVNQSSPRVWTLQEERLVHEIGLRLADALTTRFTLRRLRDSEAKLEQAQRIAHVGYWDRDLDTDHVIWSDETFRIFGLVPGKSALTSAAVFELIHPEDRPTVAAALADVRRGAPRIDVEFRIVQPGGEVRAVHSQGDVVKGESGRARRIFGVVHDLTDHMLAIEALQRTQAELAHTTRVTTLGELAASIAHEVNQPLAAIVADANASLNWLAAPTPDLERVREGLEVIVEGSHRAADVLQRVRQLATKTAPNKSPVNVNRVIDDIVSLVRAQVMANEVSLERQLSDAVPAVLADRIQLQQVLINLVMNAIDAMASVTDRPRELIIRSGWHDSEHVKVAVQDSGVGLDPDTVDRLFGAFFTTKPGGMGMGLSISRSIVEAHGGRLWATANERHGAIFHFSLPVAPQP